MKKAFTVFCLLSVSCVGIPAYSAETVVVIPLQSSAAVESPEKLWGHGRPNTTTLLHDNGTLMRGTCTAESGVKFSLSKHLASWANAAAACPKNTWVCTSQDILSTLCPISSLTDDYELIGCDGTGYPAMGGLVNDPSGWLAGADPDTPHWGNARSAEVSATPVHNSCTQLRVWCCRE